MDERSENHGGADDPAGPQGDAGPPDATPPSTPLEKIEHSSATARVPDAVGRGVFATGVIVLGGATELALDFVQSLARPERLAARVILPHVVAHRFADALTEAIAIYARSYGTEPREPVRVAPPATAPAAASPAVPAQPAAQPPGEVPSSPRIAAVYDRLKYPDEMLGGAYANQVSISHSGNEFCLDFVVQLFPRSVVTTRVYLAATRVPDLLASIRRSLRG